MQTQIALLIRFWRKFTEKLHNRLMRCEMKCDNSYRIWQVIHKRKSRSVHE